jgi:hypothetical protein
VCCDTHRKQGLNLARNGSKLYVDPKLWCLGEEIPQLYVLFFVFVSSSSSSLQILFCFGKGIQQETGKNSSVVTV